MHFLSRKLFKSPLTYELFLSLFYICFSICESDSPPTSILSRLNVLVVTTKADSKTAGNRVLFRVVNVNPVFNFSCFSPILRSDKNEFVA